MFSPERTFHRANTIFNFFYSPEVESAPESTKSPAKRKVDYLKSLSSFFDCESSSCFFSSAEAISDSTAEKAEWSHGRG